jgi:hypothetical protein
MWRFYKEHGLASAKGIAIMAVIIGGIAAASLVIWLVPQGGPSATNITDNQASSQEAANLPADNLSFVYTQHSLTATEVSNTFDKWTKGEVSADAVKGAIAKARSDAQALRNRLTAGPPQEWKQSYSLYTQALDKFNAYLDEMARIVDAGDRGASLAQLNSIKQEMDGLVNKSVSSFPT